jgi:hypothetical protein
LPGSSNSPVSDKRPLVDFALWLLALCGLRLMIGWVEVPVAMIPWASLAVSVLFVAAPVIALFRGATFPWTWKSSLVAVLVGVGIQLGSFFLMRQVRVPMVAGIVDSMGQAGLITWCLGVGGLLSASLRDKNMLVPIAIFLALFDIWLVFVPEGPVGQIARGTQVNLAKIAYHIPAVATQSSGGFARNLAYIGPADFLFLGMFFVALFKFKLRTKETARAMVPALALYLLVVLIFPGVHVGPITLGALPALLPIGAVVLGVNWREFKMIQEEVITTVVLVVLGVAILVWRFKVNAESPPAPLPTGPSPAEQAPPGSPDSGPRDPRPSPPPGAPASKSNLL